MTAPFVPVDNSTDPKYHVIDGKRYDRVTAALEVVDKGRLKYWAANLAADAALELLPRLVAAAMVRPCSNTNNRCYLKHGRDQKCERCPCNQCQPCLLRIIKYKHEAESRRRRDEGIELHRGAEAWALQNGLEIDLPKVVHPYWAQFKTWLADFGLTPADWKMAETRVFHPEHMYAGTTDAAVLITGATPHARAWLAQKVGREQALVRINYKTREKPDPELFTDMSIQEAAYDWCPFAVDRDGKVYVTGRTDVCAILQLTPVGYLFAPVRTSEVEFQQFLGVLSFYRWLQAEAKTALDPPPLPPLVANGDLPRAPTRVVQLPAGDAQPVDGPVDEDGWPVVAPIPDTPPIPPGVPNVPPEAPKKPARKPAAKKATPELARPSEATIAASPILRSMSQPLSTGAQPALLDEEIPF